MRPTIAQGRIRGVPIEYKVDHERRLVRARAFDVLTDADVFGYQQSAWSSPEVSGYDELVDLTDVVRIALPSVERMRDLARLSREMEKRDAASRFAILAPGDLAYMLGRLYKGMRALTGGRKHVGVFRTEAEALQFLGRT
jgi:hypothetical protein